ncbi:sterol desaturase family protein [Sphingomonas sp. LB-2]|uniref:sterol desaturase family protein n=1 Tax=Sphingomonas caeni TaxID=2984949 RepID=UPI0022326966|nr:sterol desaturase family protein [Sphingomonas caeni]MCW3848459.1 sterol desaturase family protein [Sphingomonas caeni]
MFGWTNTLPVAEPEIVAVPAALFLLIGLLDYRFRLRGTRWSRALAHVFPAELYRRQANSIGFVNYCLSLALIFKGGGVVTSLIAAQAIAGAGVPLAGVGGWTGVAIQVALIWLAHDFGNYVQHRAQHASPLLWRFHRPHHSAEVLTPFVQIQGHPIDLLVGMAIEFPFTLAGAVLALMLTGGSFLGGTLGGLGVVAGIGQLKGALGHSHLAICFGWWNRLVLAPVTHQIHHSAEARHRGRNFGSNFGIWDWMFGTLYVPEPGERFRLGLDAASLGADNPYRTAADIYCEPVASAAAMVGEAIRPVGFKDA